jgi:4-amino-4-deoxy-L-arabinose transferase-like glycosyltransferase
MIFTKTSDFYDSWRGVTTLALVTAVTRLPALVHPRPIDDEQVYAVVARVMLAGGKPYVDAIERKPPLLFWLYRDILAVAGASNWAALHVVMLAWTLATMACLYVTARRLWTPGAGWWAAALYSTYVPWGDYRTLALNGELLMNLPLCAALALALIGSADTRRLRLFGSGVLVGIAVLLKQPAGIAILPMAYYAYRGTPGPRPASLRFGDAAAAAAGFAGVLGVAMILLQRGGILREAVYWSVLDHQVPIGTWIVMTLRNGPLEVALFTISALPLLLAAYVTVRAGRARGPLDVKEPAAFETLLVFLGVSIVGVVSNAQFNVHYFLQLLPPLVLLAAPSCALAFETDASHFPWNIRPMTLGRWFAATTIVFLIVNSITISLHRHGSDAAAFVRAHSVGGDRLFVWGQSDQQTGMYLDAGLLPASRDISIYPLTGMLFGNGHDAAQQAGRIRPEALAAFEHDMDAHPPRFIIDADVTGHGYFPLERYPIVARYLARYRPVCRATDGIVYESVTTAASSSRTATK